MLNKISPVIVRQTTYCGMKHEMNLTDSEFLLLQLSYNQIDNSTLFFSDLPFNIFDALWQFLLCDENMPYETQKNREGDPDEWIFQELEEYYHKELTGYHYYNNGKLRVIKEE